MEYLIVHRAGEIYKLRFDRDGEDLFLTHHAPGFCYPVLGHREDLVKDWLDERGFSYYWESDSD